MKVRKKKLCSFFEFYPYFSAAFIMAISNGQLRMTEGQMKQLVNCLKEKRSFEVSCGEMKQLDN